MLNMRLCHMTASFSVWVLTDWHIPISSTSSCWSLLKVQFPTQTTSFKAFPGALRLLHAIISFFSLWQSSFSQCSLWFCLDTQQWVFVHNVIHFSLLTGAVIKGRRYFSFFLFLASHPHLSFSLFSVSRFPIYFKFHLLFCSLFLGSEILESQISLFLTADEKIVYH